jgi:hypothetical protein
MASGGFPPFIIVGNLTMSARGFQAKAGKKVKAASTTFVLRGDYPLSACFLGFSSGFLQG